MTLFHDERHPLRAKKLYDDYKPYQNMNRNLTTLKPSLPTFHCKGETSVFIDIGPIHSWWSHRSLSHVDSITQKGSEIFSRTVQDLIN